MTHPTEASPPPRLGSIWWIVLFGVTALLIAGAYFSFRHSEQKHFEELPRYFSLPEFRFVSQEGKDIAKKDLLGNIWIIDFVFTRCPGPCPMITAHMRELGEKLAKAKNVKLLSVTVDPAYDTPEILKEYAARQNADPQKWLFLTGNPNEVQQFISAGMKQALVPGSSPSDLPTHSTRLMIVDADGIIRSIRDTNDPEVDQKVLVDIGSLLQELQGQQKKERKGIPSPSTP